MSSFASENLNSESLTSDQVCDLNASDSSLANLALLLDELKREREKNKRLQEMLASEAQIRKKMEDRISFLGQKQQQIHDNAEREEEGFVNKVWMN